MKSCLIFFTITINLIYSSVRYVSPVAKGVADGSSWDNASSDLQQMLDYSQGGEVWVSSGTYMPQKTPPYNVPSTDRDRTFFIRSGAKLYGGFKGNETSIEERDILNNETILNGNIGDSLSNLDNCYHVILIYSTDVGSATIDGFTIMGGNANMYGSYDFFTTSIYSSCGGGVYGNGNLNFKNNILKNNSASMGGGMYTKVGYGLSISNCHIFENNANDGAGLSIGKATVKKVFVYNNHANSQGGGIYLLDDSQLTDCEIYNNTSKSNGGGLWSNNSNTSISNCYIYNNIAEGSGGGIYSIGNSFSISHVEFNKNKAMSGGGASLSFNIRMNDCNFHDNEASENGGGVIIGASSLQTNNVTFQKNSSKKAGGGMYVSAENGQVSNVTIAQNTSTNGGGLYVSRGSCIFNYMTIVDNLALANGGGMFVDESIFSLTNSLIVRNTSSYNAGAIFTYYAINNLISNTICNNIAKELFGGVYTYEGDNNLTNNIICSNRTPAFQQETSYFAYNGINHVSYNLFSHLQTEFTNGDPSRLNLMQDSLHNIFTKDLFFLDSTDLDGPDNIFGTQDDGLRLTAQSPAYNAGNNTALVDFTLTDYVGGLRIQDKIIDIGAYEGLSLTSIEDSHSLPASIYPNPSYGIIHLETIRIADKISILGIKGNLIHEFIPKASNIVLDVSQYHNGIYYVKIESKETERIYKIIINQ